ncbi:MAG: hypothetical protein KC636_36840 [Myxococcales bacterium]|nr:hypothetical protein [Myxococcales bacterium]
MTPRIFVAQSLIDSWIASGAADLDRDLLRVPVAGSRVPLFITPAVHFDRIDGGDPDPNELLGRVKTAPELAQLGAEHYETAVMVGDFAYTVTPGFVATPVDARGEETSLDTASWGRLLTTLEGLEQRAAR